MSALCAEIGTQLSSLFVCAPHDRYVRIRTPFMYPDGDVIDVFYTEQGGVGVMSDLGESVRWLRMQTVSQKRTPKQRQLIEDICATHGVEFFRGTLVARVLKPEALGDSVARLAQAALRVADIWFTFRTRTLESATDEVAEFLTERAIPFDRGEKLVGRSGRSWTIDFHTRTPRRSSLVYVLSTGSRAASRGITEHVLAAWYDLNHLAVGPEPLRFVSLFDDTMDVWAPEDFRLLDPLSDIARWSRPDEVESLLRPAA